MAVENATPEQKRAFGEALIEALQARSLRPPDLVDVISAADRNKASAKVSHWVRGVSEPSRPTVVAIERFLNLEPGTLSRHLGWVPVVAPVMADPEAAIIADGTLTGEERRILLALLKKFRDK